jgi:nitrogen regulatory protein P-II 1
MAWFRLSSARHSRQPATDTRKGFTTKIEAIIRPNKFEAVKEALIQAGTEGMTLSEVRGHGRQKGHTEVYRGREYEVDLLPKVKLEIVVQDTAVDKVVQAILDAAYTGKIGDGKIFLYKLEDAIRIRSQERGVVAV